MSSPSYKLDPRYKKYVLAVEKTLQTFEAIDEWADIISFLTKFCKTLQSFPSFKNVPKKVLVSKRLAQCLNPALPSGVHQKALEAYSIIFEKIEKSKLVTDFYVYSYGILPFFRHCSLSVKKTYLTIFEKYLLPLATDLPGSLKSLILALLPGLEEEGNEYFIQVRNLLLDMKDAVGSVIFLRTIWTCLLYSVQLRLAVVHLFSHIALPKEYLYNMVVSDQTLMIQALSSSLTDSQSLVCRGSLELVLKAVPVDNDFIKEDEMLYLVQQILHVFLKRDISLSRRCISWLLGLSTKTVVSQEKNIGSASLSLLSMAFKRMLTATSDDIGNISSSFRILVSLLDKPEIGIPLSKIIMVDVINSVFRYYELFSVHSPEKIKTLLESANMFFEVADLQIVWTSLYRFLISFSSISSSPYEVLLFVLKNLKVCDNEAEHIHLPFLMAQLVFILKSRSWTEWLDALPEVLRVYDTCLAVANKIPQSYLKSKSQVNQPADQGVPDVIKFIEQFYTNDAFQESLTLQSQQFLILSSRLVLDSVLENVIGIATEFSVFASSTSSPGLSSITNNSNLSVILDKFSTLFDWAINSNIALNQIDPVNERPHDRFVTLCSSLFISFYSLEPIDSLSIIIKMLIMLSNNSTFSNLLLPTFLEEVPKMYEKLWKAFDQDQIQRFQVCELFWLVDSASTGEQIDSFFTAILANANLSEIERFIHFWEISDSVPLMRSSALKKCLFVMIELIDDPFVPRRRLGLAWLGRSLRKISRLIDPILSILSSKSIITSHMNMVLYEQHFNIPIYELPFDYEQILYTLESLNALARRGYTGLVEILDQEIPGQFSRELNMISVSDSKSYSYLLFNLLSVLLFTEVTADLSASASEQESLDAIQMTCLDLFLLLLESSSSLDDIIVESFCDRLISKLYYVVSMRKSQLQPKILETLLLLSRKSSAAKFFEKFWATFPQLSKPATHDDMSLCSFQLMLLDGLNPDNAILHPAWLEFIFSFFSMKELDGCLCIFPILVSLLTFESKLLSSNFSRSVTRLFSSSFSAAYQQIISHLSNLLALVDYLLSFSAPANGQKSSFLYNKNPSSSPVLGGLRLWSGFLHHATFLWASSGEGSGTSPKFPLEEKLLILLHDIFSAYLDLIIFFKNLEISSHSHEYFFLENALQRCVSSFQDLANILYSKNPGYFFATFLSLWSGRLSASISSFLYSAEYLGNASDPSSQNYDLFFILSQFTATVQPAEFIQYVIEYYRETFFTYNKGISAKQGAIPIGYASMVNVTEATLLILLEQLSLLQPQDEHNFSNIQSLCEMQAAILQFGKDCLASQSRRKSSLLGLLHWTKALQSSFFGKSEDKKVVRDFSEYVQKLIESSILFISKSSSDIAATLTSSTIKRRDSLTLTSTVQGETGEAQKYNDLTNDEQQTISQSILTCPTTSSIGTSIATSSPHDSNYAHQMLTFLTNVIIPSLDQFFAGDQEKLSSIYNAIVYYLINPFFKSSLKDGRLDPNSSLYFDLLAAVAKFPGSIKTWRKEYYDFYMDIKYFSMSPVFIFPLVHRRTLTNLVMMDDSEKILEHINKITIASSTGMALFSSKEAEIANRNLSIRRLAYIIFLGNTDQFVPWFPSIQEKIVELFKNRVSSSYSALFLLLRAVWLRFSNRHLPNLYPILMTEMIKLFNGYNPNCDTSAEDSTSTDLDVVWAMCKFLEVLCKVSFEDMQNYLWIFLHPRKSDELQTSVSSDCLTLVGDESTEVDGLLGGLVSSLSNTPLDERVNRGLTNFQTMPSRSNRISKSTQLAQMRRRIFSRKKTVDGLSVDSISPSSSHEAEPPVTLSSSLDSLVSSTASLSVQETSLPPSRPVGDLQGSDNVVMKNGKDSEVDAIARTVSNSSVDLKALCVTENASVIASKLLSLNHVLLKDSQFNVEEFQCFSLGLLFFSSGGYGSASNFLVDSLSTPRSPASASNDLSPENLEHVWILATLPSNKPYYFNSTIEQSMELEFYSI